LTSRHHDHFSARLLFVGYLDARNRVSDLRLGCRFYLHACFLDGIFDGPKQVHKFREGIRRSQWEIDWLALLKLILKMTAIVIFLSIAVLEAALDKFSLYFSLVLPWNGAVCDEADFVAEADGSNHIDDDELVCDVLSWADVEVEPDVVSVGVDIILDEHVVVPSLFAFEDAVQVAAFEISRKGQVMVVRRTWLLVEACQLIAGDTAAQVADKDWVIVLRLLVMSRLSIRFSLNLLYTQSSFLGKNSESSIAGVSTFLTISSGPSSSGGSFLVTRGSW
jgi:hypothetical protein